MYYTLTTNLAEISSLLVVYQQTTVVQINQQRSHNISTNYTAITNLVEISSLLVVYRQTKTPQTNQQQTTNFNIISNFAPIH
tara:strand:+ start:339 stop:584 length:246 start_codon:yes stop_codon:yes gene_type:complete